MPDTRATDVPRATPVPRARRALWLLALFLAELAALTILYQFFARIECFATEAEGFCRGLRSLVSRALGVSALLALLLWARPKLTHRFLTLGATRSGGPFWIALHALGVALMLVPLLVAGGRDMAPDFLRLAPAWAFGALAAAIGGLGWLIRPSAWAELAGADQGAILFTISVGLLLPDLADLALPLWSHWPALTSATFNAVAGLLTLMGLSVYVDAPGFILGLQTFAVHVAQQCSGVEGMALVTGFTLVYALLFRNRLRWWRYWSIVLPLGVAASWLLNVIRIAGLILIGEYVSPELAVNGFHSFAGTLFFTLLALALMWVVQATPWLHREGYRPVPVPGLREDWLAACLLPFIIFMLLSTLVSALFIDPEAGYPIKAIGMGLSLFVFLPALRVKNWSPRLLPLVVGGLIGLFWLALADPDEARRAQIVALLGAYSTIGVAAWVLLRLVGTVIFVPVIEELFFRGYLLTRLDSPSLLRRGFALALTSLAFGALHGRWIEGALSGLAFGLLYLRRSRIADPVWAHVAANLIVGLGALYSWDWSLI